VPGEYRAELQRLIVIQGDTEPASVEQQRNLGATAPSLYDLRNLFQVNVEEGRHLWAMVYLLQQFIEEFSGTGREDTAARLVELVHAWRRLVAIDPALPRELLPARWIGLQAASLFADRRGRWGAEARIEWKRLNDIC
jgi:benzoyl-CoA 2,3-dioxygenase component B